MGQTRIARGPVRMLAPLLVLACLLTGLTALTTTSADAVRVRQAPARSWGVNGVVYATAIVGDKVVVGGSFKKAVSPGGKTERRLNLAAFDRRSGRLLSWRADAGSTVRVLRLAGNKLYVGGTFNRIGGQEHHRIARLNAHTGEVDATFDPDASGPVYGIAVDDSGIYLGGAFKRVDGVNRPRLAKLDPVAGELDKDFRAPANGTVTSVAKHRTAKVLYVGGGFSRIRNGSRSGVAAVDARTGTLRRVRFSGAVRATYGVTLNGSGTMLYAATGGRDNSVVAWSTRNGARRWHHRAMGDMQAVAYHRGYVYFGFHDGFGGDRSLKLLAARASNGALDGAFRPRFNHFWGVRSIAASSTGVLAGGEFTKVGGATRRHWAWFPRR